MDDWRRHSGDDCCMKNDHLLTGPGENVVIRPVVLQAEAAPAECSGGLCLSTAFSKIV